MPQSGECVFLVRIEGRLPDSKEFPAASFQLPLALHVRFVAVRAMPIVAIAFNRKPRLSALDHKIDSLAGDFMLRSHSIVPAEEFQGHIHFKPAIKWWGWLDDDSVVSAVPDIPLLPVFRGYEGIGFRKLFGAIA